MKSRARMPAPEASSTPAVPREELLRRLHERQKSARGGGGAAATPLTGHKAVERATQAAMNMSPAQLAKMEALLEECDGNIALFCQKSGVDAAFLPSIQKAVESMSAGMDQKTAISTAAAEVVELAKNMRAR
jgi:hypothetical protein